ncbi:hypothetical protein Q5698_08465 [Brucella intermedia]|uniref:hypothetical protein n=1 Tax=Brucella intermedia TaxID=94625 RepID=UPI002735EE18|nr:hypothetical protein [Brucella intermedia]WLF95703.1 hypothetical protein Q5698_08465 [Brucella intermedia]
MNIAVQLTHTDFANALSRLTNSVNRPRYLSDVLEIKQARGDDDIAFFKLQCRMFQSRFGATIEGAHKTALKGDAALRIFAEMLEEFM